MKMGSMSCTSVMMIARLARVDSGLFLSWSLKKEGAGREDKGFLSGKQNYSAALSLLWL